MSQLIRRVIAISLGFAVLIVAARLIGTLNASPAAVAQFRAQYCDPQPCWQGIRPTVSTLQQIKVLIHVDPDNPRPACWNIVSDSALNACVFAPDNDVVRTIYIFPPSTLRLSDLVMLYGAPISSTLCLGDDVDGIDPPLFFLVRFKGDVVVRGFDPSSSRSKRLNPNLPVLQITYGTARSVPEGTTWHGFSALRHVSYCD